MNRSKGFTLIELLVVIAIIGILSSVVLASLNTARNKGSFAKVQAQVNAARTAAENYYSSNGGYSTVTAVTANSGAGCTNMFADSSSGFNQYTTAANYPSGTTFTCGSNGTAYVFGATWNAQSFCVDSAGNATTSVTNYAAFKCI